MEYISRYAERKFIEISKTHTVALLQGPPYVGKMTMLTHLSEGTNRSCVSLRDPEAAKLARENPVGFLQKYPPPLLVGDISKAPQLLPVIKWRIDSGQDAPGFYWLTSTMDFSRIPNYASAIAPHAAQTYMYGLSQGEIAGVPWKELCFDPESLLERQKARKGHWSSEQVLSFIRNGSLPAMLGDALPAHERQAYFEAYLERILDTLVEHESLRHRDRVFGCLRVCAKYIGQPLRASHMAELAQISPSCLQRWFDLFIAHGIIRRPKAMGDYEHRGNRLQSPRIYFTDTGFAAWLRTLPGEGPAEERKDGLYVNYVIMELLKNLEYGTMPFTLGYFPGVNIDIVLEQGGVFHALDVAYSRNPNPGITQAFEELETRELPSGPGGIICMAGSPVSIGSNCAYIPSWLL